MSLTKESALLRPNRLTTHTKAGRFTLPQVDEIDRLYAEVARLATEEVASGSAENRTELKAQLHSRWTRLRKLQETEAEAFFQAFEASLELPLDAGAQILREAQALKAELENPTASD